MPYGERTKVSVHLDNDLDTKMIVEEPKIEVQECGHVGTGGHAFWLKIETGRLALDFCFGNDKMAMDRFASALSEAVTAFVG